MNSGQDWTTEFAQLARAFPQAFHEREEHEWLETIAGHFEVFEHRLPPAHQDDYWTKIDELLRQHGLVSHGT